MSEKFKTEVFQNQHFKQTAEALIKKMSDKNKKNKLKELEKIGYEYNKDIDVLLKFETVIPYNFVLYCLLVEDKKND